MKIHDFVTSRIVEARVSTLSPHHQDIFDAMLTVVEMHKNFPVLVEKKPEFKPANLFDDFNAGLDSYRIQMVQEIMWMQGREYVKVFGEDPPTTPMLRRIASIWSNHPDFDPAWHLSKEEWARALGQQSL